MSRFRQFAFAMIGCCWLGAAQAQPFPNRPVTIIVPVAPGGFLDYVARLLGAPLSKALGHAVIADTEDVKKAAAASGITPRYMAPAELDQVVRTDLIYWSKVIRDAGIKAD